jgi:protein-arginine kinase activator protein McsA
MPLNYVEIKSPSRIFIDTSVKLTDKNETATDLRRRLDQAVRDERYEEAAAIRDRLKQQEQGGEGGKS